MKNLKDFQEKAKNKLFEASKTLLLDNNSSDSLLIFKSPTGSGKTLTITKYIEEMVSWSNSEEVNQDLVFLFVSIGKGDLEVQSYESLEENLKGETKLYKLEEVYNNNYLNCGDVVVFNWEKIRSKDQDGKWKNISMKDGDFNNFRICLDSTKNNNSKIILIIDESHSGADTERSNELINKIIKPNLTIEMSATPKLKDYTQQIKVNPQDVIDEGMIKKEIIINEKINDGDSESAILESAFAKRIEIEKAYKDKGINIKPLCIIQIPSSENGNIRKENIELFLKNKGIDVHNNRLAIHLNEEKINNERKILCEPNNKVEFLIFKQAIDTGWDCPRAHILIKFRESVSIIFELQTVGRIIRMPEQKHYNDNILDNAYVYTTDYEFEIKYEESDPNIIKQHAGYRNKTYKNLNLKSFYKNRVDFGDIEADFYLDDNGFRKEIINDIFMKQLGKNYEELSANLNIGSSAEMLIIKNEKIKSTNVDEKERKTKLKTQKILTSENDLNIKFDKIIKDNLNGFAQRRSVPTIRQGIFGYFTDIGITHKKYDSHFLHIKNICVNNEIKFGDILSKAIIRYRELKEEKNKKEISGQYEIWEICKYYNHDPNSTKKYQYRNFVFDKAYLKFDSNLEEKFTKKLDEFDNVDWWWKNGREHKKENFGIKYLESGDVKTFQPDFIVKFKDNKIGIFDTKDMVDRGEDTKIKAEALQKYIKENKNKDLIGGIIIENNNRFYINSSDKYKTYKEKEDDWSLFE